MNLQSELKQRKQVTPRTTSLIEGKSAVLTDATLVERQFIGRWTTLHTGIQEVCSQAVPAIAQIEAGADLIFAERFGVFEAAKEKSVLAFGNMSDQNALAPDVVITGPVWDMYPTIKFCIEMVQKKAWVSMDLGEWSMMAKGGARLAPFHSFEKTLPASVIKEVRDLEQKILNGTFRVPVDEQKPVSD